jgi:hypothetical protein
MAEKKVAGLGRRVVWIEASSVPGVMVGGVVWGGDEWWGAEEGAGCT